MKSIFFGLFVMVMIFGCAIENDRPSKSEKSLSQTKIMTFNIRYNNPDDVPNDWDSRKSDVVKLIQYYNPDILGIQEALPDQLTFLSENLVDYSFCGLSRDGKGSFSEGTPIFYKSKFRLINTETFWLSDTPDTVSTGWDAALNRIAVYGQFLRSGTSDTLNILNTHFDHLGEDARMNSAKLLIEKIEQYDVGEQKLVIMGDFNCTPIHLPYKLLNDRFADTFLSSDTPPYGPQGTWNGFGTVDRLDRRIDFIFSKNAAISSHRIIDDRRQNNLYPSDHFPVFIELY